jgi:solute:Na+ symporter, SSS family
MASPGLSTFSTPDFVVLLVYLVGIVSIGSFFYRRKSSTHDFFFAGHSVAWIPISVSIIATNFSAIAYLGLTAFPYRRDLELLPMLMMGPLVVMPIVIYFLVPFYHRLHFSTAYEYLEWRFDVRVRTVTSFLFLILRGFYMGIVIYAPSLVLSTVAGLPLYESILLLGLFTTVYTTLGGMRAVIWTDFIQFSMVVLGMAAVISIAYSQIGGGWSEIWHTAHALGKTRLFDFTLSPNREFTFWAVLIGSGFFILNTFTTDQIIVQRYMTARSEAECKKALILQTILQVIVTLPLQATGLILAVYYFRHAGESQSMVSPDAVLPFFVVRHIATGLRALIVASIFAASTSVMSGGINSLTTATVVDFYKRLWRQSADDAACLRVARFATLGWGAIATVAALFVSRLGQLAYAYDKVNSFVGGVMLGIFMLAMLTRRTDGLSALMGAATGLTAVVLVANLTSVSWIWYALIGCAITIGTGCVVARITNVPTVKNGDLLMFPK